MISGTGSDDEARAKYVKAYDQARAAGDHEAMAAAALRLAGMQMFGLVPGRIPAFLHEAYEHAHGRQRVELAIAIARAWGYGYEPDRARQFAAEAINSEHAAADPALLAAALDAALVVAWGPDDFDERLAITERLEDVTAHVTEPDVLMSAYLWRLTTALECLDVPAMRRQLRSLDQLATETGAPRIKFFSAARRGMHALVVGDPDEAERARREAIAAGAEAAEPDTFAIDRALSAAIARQRNDIATIASEAARYEEFGRREGVISVAAEAAGLWLAAGEPARAELLLHQLAGADFSRIPRDVDWLLTVTVLTEVAASAGAVELCTHAAELLTPYRGRGISNAGAVLFGGVVDHYLSMAHAALGERAAADEALASASAAYQRFGATWWGLRCHAPAPASRDSDAVFRPVGDGVWEVGRGQDIVTIREMKGLRYLRLLLAHPSRDLTAVELTALAAGGTADQGVVASGLPVADSRALAAYRARLAEIDEALDSADEGNDQARSVALSKEREAILDQLRAATGLGGRRRAAAGTDERARVAVRKAIAAAIERLSQVDASLARLLTDTVTTGSLCRYDPHPERPITWRLG